ncbi:MAG: hypothetical protein WC510_03565 [Candidatus Omnitrophota bacterium]
MRKVFFITAALILLLISNSFAQEKQTPATGTQAAEAQKQETKTIFSYKKELGLTDKQEADIKKLLLDLQNTFTQKAKMLNVLRQELNQMISERQDLKAIRKKIEDVAKIQVDNTFMDIETSRKIESIMSTEQIKKWQDIQKQMREMMQAVKK